MKWCKWAEYIWSALDKFSVTDHFRLPGCEFSASHQIMFTSDSNISQGRQIVAGQLRCDWKPPGLGKRLENRDSYAVWQPADLANAERKLGAYSSQMSRFVVSQPVSLCSIQIRYSTPWFSFLENDSYRFMARLTMNVNEFEPSFRSRYFYMSPV